MPGVADEERIGEGAGKGDVNAPERGADTVADVEQSQGIQAGALEFGTLPGLAKPLDEHASEGREQEAERVGVEQVAGAPPGEEDGRVVLDSVFRISSYTIVFLVELLGRMSGSRRGSHREVRIVRASGSLRFSQDLGIGSHTAPTRPDRAGPPPEGPEAPRRPARVQERRIA